MAQVERKQEEKRDNRRAQRKQARGRRADANGAANIRGINWVCMAAAITAFAESGGAIRVGFTRDGGAFAIGCYLGDDYATEYVRPNEDFGQAIAEIAEAWLPENGLAYHQAYNEYSRNAGNGKGA